MNHDRIWLIWDGEGWVWAADPNPAGVDDAPDSIAYVRADKALDLIGRLSEWLGDASRDAYALTRHVDGAESTRNARDNIIAEAKAFLRNMEEAK